MVMITYIIDIVTPLPSPSTSDITATCDVVNALALTQSISFDQVILPPFVSLEAAEQDLISSFNLKKEVLGPQHPALLPMLW